MKREKNWNHLIFRCLCILLICLALSMNVLVLETLATEELTNYALRGTATMSHTHSGNHVASHAIDGQVSTYAQAANKGEVWDLTVDIGEAKTISKFNVIVGYSNRATSYTIYYSNDGESWTEAAVVTDVKTSSASPYADNISELTTPVTARYFKVDVTAVTEKDSAHTIREFQIWGTEPSSDGDVELVNLAPLGGVTATMLEGTPTYQASKAIDGNVGTYAQANAKGQMWDLQVDLGGARVVHKFNVIVGYSNRATAYTIQYSQDGET